MKFVCDSCNTKYSIADERVHGRVLKIRCKTCDHVITVREEMKVSDSASSIAEALGRRLNDEGNDHTMVSMAPPSAPAEKVDEWYISFDGDQEGPLPLARALERVRAERPRGREAHCWKPGFFVWLAVEEVPEFAPALERPRWQSAPPPPPAASPSRPIAVARPAPLLSPMPATPAAVQPVAAQPTASQSAALAPLGGGLEPLPPLDSKPVPLPPPPELMKDLPLNLPLPSGPLPLPGGEPVPSGMMAMQLTRPEPRLARRAHADEPDPFLPLPSPAADKAPALLREPAAPEISAFAAALAAATGKEPRQDTGPVPLPPPPGSDADLAISEPSGLLSISHLTQAVSPISRTTDKAVFDTFGGVAVTPAGSNGATASAPVVVVAGPVQSAAAWVKWSVAALLLLVIGLAGTVVYLWSGRLASQTPLAGTTTAGGKHVDNQPIELNDPAPPTSIGTPNPVDPGKNAPPLKHNPPLTKAPPTAPGVKPVSLSNDQKNLAALYGESGEKAAPKDTSAGNHADHAQGQVSQTSILAVVTQNRRALNLCYDRVLKHDSTLKRARLVTHVKVGLSGSVTGVSIPDPTYADSEIGQCLTQTIKRWHFPSADAEYETEFPIILQAE